MNVYLFELKMYRKSIITWSLVLFGLTFWFMAFYPAMSNDSGMVDLIMENYPEEMLQAFGMNTGLALSSVLGFYIFTFGFLQLCMAIQSSNYGFSMLSVEERELTADFLMSKPVSRSRIIISKFMAVFTALAISQVAIWIGTFVGIEMFKGDHTYDAGKVMLLLATIVCFQLFFVCIGMLVSVLVKKIRNVLSFSMGISFGLYTLNALKNILGGDTLGLISPFFYYEPGYILENGRYDMPFFAIGIIVTIVAGALSYVLYLRRNIHSV